MPPIAGGPVDERDLSWLHSALATAEPFNHYGLGFEFCEPSWAPWWLAPQAPLSIRLKGSFLDGGGHDGGGLPMAVPRRQHGRAAAQRRHTVLSQEWMGRIT